MAEQPIEEFVAQHQARRGEELRSPAVEVFDRRSVKPLPLSVREFFQVGERLHGSGFTIDCGQAAPIFVQYFVPLNRASIDACESRHWRWLEIARGDEGEALLVSLEEHPTIFVEWAEHEAPEDTGIAFADFLAGVRKAVVVGSLSS